MTSFPLSISSSSLPKDLIKRIFGKRSAINAVIPEYLYCTRSCVFCVKCPTTNVTIKIYGITGSNTSVNLTFIPHIIMIDPTNEYVDIKIDIRSEERRVGKEYRCE